eukprot:5221762-Pleurochrysis_carterae.AAC.3
MREEAGTSQRDGLTIHCDRYERWRRHSTPTPPCWSHTPVAARATSARDGHRAAEGAWRLLPTICGV